MGEPTSKVPSGEHQYRTVQHLVAALIASAIAVMSIAYQVSVRSPLAMDELHSVLLGKLWAAGTPPSFYVGSVTRYEGGSYLIGLPVAVLLKLGWWGTAASSWAAGVIAGVTVFLSSFWLSQLRGPLAAVLLGVGAAFLSPELLHYSFRSWGSISESLLLWPILGLIGSRWHRAGQPRWGLPVLGLLLGLGIIFSYWHFVTSLGLAACLLSLAGRGALSKGVAQVSVAATTALIVLVLWFVSAVPFFGEGLMVRDGLWLHHTLPRLFLVRLDLVLMHLPGAWVGEHLELTTLRVSAGIGLTLLTGGALVAAWRHGGELRWAVLMFLVCLPALSVGQRLLDAPQVYRYYIPLLATSIFLIAAWHWRAMLCAVLLSMTFWFPSGLEMPGQSPERSHMELGGNAFHRYDQEPHIKYNTYREVVSPAFKNWFAFGYGLDSGMRYSPTRSSMTEGVRESGATPNDIATNPQLSLYHALSWSRVEGDPVGDLPFFFRGMGAGMGADGQIDPLEGELLGKLPPEQRAAVMTGFGATLGQMLAAGTAPATWSVGLGGPPSPADWEALARGVVAVGAAHLILGEIPGVELSSGERDAIRRGLQSAPADNLTEMMQVPMVPTPLPPPPR